MFDDLIRDLENSILEKKLEERNSREIPDGSSSEEEGTQDSTEIVPKKVFDVSGQYSKAQGFLFFEFKGEFRRMFCVLRKSKLYFAQGDNDSLELLLSLTDHDVCSLSERVSNLPTEFGFALKHTKYSNDEDCRVFGVEKEQSCNDWIMALRFNKNKAMLKEEIKKKPFENINRKGSLKSGSLPSSPDSQDSLRGRNDEDEPLFEQLQRNSGGSLERKNSIKSNASWGSDDQRKGRSKPLLSFKSGDGSSSIRNELKDCEVTQKKGKNKLLIDVSDANLCQTCGCSEFRGIFTGKREAQCGNCLHAHDHL